MITGRNTKPNFRYKHNEMLINCAMETNFETRSIQRMRFKIYNKTGRSQIEK